MASGVYTINALPTTGMLLWLNADAITGISNGGSVTTWNDMSGNGNNAVFTQPGGVVSPRSMRPMSTTACRWCASAATACCK